MQVQIEDDWEGWDGETVVRLTNGRYYQQSQYHYEYMYAYRPMASLEGGSLHVAGMSAPVPVREIHPVVSRVSGEWQGWDGETTVELENGQVWKQARYKYEYKYKYRPEAIIFDNKMHVEGMSSPVQVERVR